MQSSGEELIMASEEAESQSPFHLIFNKNIPHIFEEIFFNLDYDSLVACQKVSKAWRGLLSSKLFKKRAEDLLVEKRTNEQELYHFSEIGKTTEVTRLLSIGTDPNCNTMLGNPPLIVAAMNGHREVVEILLNAGANPDKFGVLGRTALHGAAMFGQKNIVKLLLDAGAQVNLKDNFGYSPRQLANIYGHREIAQILGEKRAKLRERCRICLGMLIASLLPIMLLVIREMLGCSN